MSYDETIVKNTVIYMQNNNNIDVLNCKANTRSSYNAKTAILHYTLKRLMQKMGSFIIIKGRLNFLNK